MTAPQSPKPEGKSGQGGSSSRAATLSLLIFVVILASSFIALFRYQAEVEALARTIIEASGGWGVGIGFFLIDAFSLPIPNDILTVFGRMGGMGFWEVSAWASVGSTLGGSMGWWIGRYWISKISWLRAWVEAQGDQSVARVQKWGAWFVGFAAVSPLPYSLVCWGAGIVRLPFGPVFAASTLRVVRVALYLWLIEQGIVDLGSASPP